MGQSASLPPEVKADDNSSASTYTTPVFHEHNVNINKLNKRGSVDATTLLADDTNMSSPSGKMSLSPSSSRRERGNLSPKNTTPERPRRSSMREIFYGRKEEVASHQRDKQEPHTIALGAGCYWGTEHHFRDPNKFYKWLASENRRRLKEAHDKGLEKPKQIEGYLYLDSPETIRKVEKRKADEEKQKDKKFQYSWENVNNPYKLWKLQERRNARAEVKAKLKKMKDKEAKSAQHEIIPYIPPMPSDAKDGEIIGAKVGFLAYGDADGWKYSPYNNCGNKDQDLDGIVIQEDSARRARARAVTAFDIGNDAASSNSTINNSPSSKNNSAIVRSPSIKGDRFQDDPAIWELFEMIDDRCGDGVGSWEYDPFRQEDRYKVYYSLDEQCEVTIPLGQWRCPNKLIEEAVDSSTYELIIASHTERIKDKDTGKIISKMFYTTCNYGYYNINRGAKRVVEGRSIAAAKEWKCQAEGCKKDLSEPFGIVEMWRKTDDSANSATTSTKGTATTSTNAGTKPNPEKVAFCGPCHAKNKEKGSGSSKPDSGTGNTAGNDTYADILPEMTLRGPWIQQPVPFASVLKRIKRQEDIVNGERVHVAMKNESGEFVYQDLKSYERNPGTWLCPLTLEVVPYGTAYQEADDGKHPTDKTKEDGEGDVDGDQEMDGNLKERKLIDVPKGKDGIWENCGLTMVVETEELLHELQKPVEERMINGKQNRKLSDLRKYPVITLTTREEDRKPTYMDVCKGYTGLVEVFLFTFQATGTTTSEEFFTEILRYFFLFHDPTTSNRQGNDKGTQYSSRIFVFSEDDEDQIPLKKNGNCVTTEKMEEKEKRKWQGDRDVREAFFDRNWMLTTAMTVLCNLQSMLHPTSFGLNRRDTAHVQKVYNSSIVRTTIHLVRKRADYQKEISKLKSTAKKDISVRGRDLYMADQIDHDIKYTTRFIPPFFPSHHEHQRYLENNPDGYCNHRVRMKSWPAPTNSTGTDVPETEDNVLSIRMTEINDIRQTSFGETKDAI